LQNYQKFFSDIVLGARKKFIWGNKDPVIFFLNFRPLRWDEIAESY
jgi:hypothetical protein